MKITYQPWGETLAELADAGRRAEEAGAEVLWVSELHRSATITAAALDVSLNDFLVGCIEVGVARIAVVSRQES